jgi:hypothetical protein
MIRTVGELIEELEKFDDDMEVRLDIGLGKPIIQLASDIGHDDHHVVLIGWRKP